MRTSCYRKRDCVWENQAFAQSCVTGVFLLLPVLKDKWDLEVSCAAKSRVPTELDLVLGCSIGSGLINGDGINGLFHPLRIMGWLVVDQISLEFSLRKLGKKSPMLTCAYFSEGVASTTKQEVFGNLCKKWDDTVDGRHPANHLDCSGVLLGVK